MANHIPRRQMLATASAALLNAAGRKPNLVFLYSDDHHFQCLGAAGNPAIRTPNLDRLASRGVLFTNGIVTTPQCCPSRGVMLSGLETFQSGLESNGRTAFRAGLGPTVVEQLRRSGYETTLIGKWHIQPQPAACGFEQAPLWLPGGSSRYLNPELCRGLGGKAGQIAGHITDLFTGAALEYLRKAKQPFLAWLSYNAPHTPWHADARYREAYLGRGLELAPPAHPKGGAEFDWETYYSVINHLDEAIGRVIAALDGAGLWDNTLVVFLGDNGYLCGTKGLQGKVYPWEESIRVPFLLSGGPVRARGPLDAPVASVDLPATFLDYAGVQPAYPLAGRSLRPELETGRSAREAAFVTWNDGRPEALAVRRVVEPYRVVRARTHKLILWESKKQALYDIRSDPGEEKDLSGHPAQAGLLNRLREQLAERMKATADPALRWLG